MQHQPPRLRPIYLVLCLIILLAGCSGGPYQGSTQTADRRGEGGAHCASVPHWTAKRVPTVVRGIGEPAPRGGSSPLTASDTTVV